VARPAQRCRDTGRASSLLLVLVTFTVVAAAVHFDGETPQTRRVNHLAGLYADAWREGRLATLDYDDSSSAEVMDDDPKYAVPSRVARRVAFIVSRLADDTVLTGGPGAQTPSLAPGHPARPESVEVVRQAARVSGSQATARLRVTWRLRASGGSRGQTFLWTYSVTLREHLAEGSWRIVWSPHAVHPGLGTGEVLGLDRSQATRSTVIGAGDTVLFPPARGRRLTAKPLLATITTQAAPGQPDLAGPRGTAPVPGLEALYDERLAAYVTVQVRSYTAALVADPADGTVARLGSPVAILFTGPPRIPPPLRVTLDRRTQDLAQSALETVRAPASLVVVRPDTGDVLASASTPPDTRTRQDPGSATARSLTLDPALASPQHPGSVFGLVSSLALLRAGHPPETRVDCGNRYVTGGRTFDNTQGPNLKDVTLKAAVNGGCVTGIARVASTITPGALQSAAFDLGLAVPVEDGGRAPGWLRVSDRMGTPAFHGQVPATGSRVRHIENAIGEGDVLVSPLSLARAAATVATGTRRALQLVISPGATRTDLARPLSSEETTALQDIMAKSVTESGGSAHSLAGLGNVHALAGVVLAGASSPGAGRKPLLRWHAWCVGYTSGYAFAVLVRDVAGSPITARSQALVAAGRFIDAVR
jgi:hypothetical protein